MMKVEIKKVKLSTIKLNPDNPRKIAGPDMDKLVKSLTDFPEMMELREIVVDENMMILGGNMRYQALKKTGAKECLAKIVKGLTDAQKREFVIKDNSNFGVYYWDVLAADWDDLPLVEWGVELPDDWAKEPDAPKDAEPQIDKAAELNKVWKVKAGDLWQIGQHKLLCGDSTKAEDVEKLMGGEKADAVVTDPPYGIGLDTDYSKMGNTTTKYQKIEGDDKPFDPESIFKLFPAKSYWLWGADYYSDKLPDGGSLMVWAKAHSEDENKVFGSSFEICWTLPRRKRELWFIRRTHMTDELLSEHPTQKPSECMMRPILISGGDIIADPFLGSGTTMVACQNLNRKCRGIEISEAYCAVILQRMTDAFPDIEIKKIER